MYPLHNHKLAEIKPETSLSWNTKAGRHPGIVSLTAGSCHTWRLGCACVGRNGCPGLGRNGCLGGMKGLAVADPGWLKCRIPTGPGGCRAGLTGLSRGNTGCCPCWLNAGPGWVNGKGLWVGTGWLLFRSVGGGGGGGGLRCSKKRWLGNLGSPETPKKKGSRSWGGGGALHWSWRGSRGGWLKLLGTGPGVCCGNSGGP